MRRGKVNTRQPRKTEEKCGHLRRRVDSVQLQRRWRRRLFCQLMLVQYAHTRLRCVQFLFAWDERYQRWELLCRGIWGVWPRHKDTAQHAPRIHCATRLGRVDWSPLHDCRRARGTHMHSNTSHYCCCSLLFFTRKRISHRSRKVLYVFIFLCVRIVCCV